MRTACLWPLLLLLLLSLVFSAPAGADDSHTLPFDLYIVPPPPVDGLEIHWEDLFGDQAGEPQSHQVHGPVHGDLSPTAEGFYYAIRPSFWEVAVDSFVLDYIQDGTREAINVVVAVGEAHRGEAEVNSFDMPVTGDADWLLYDPSGRLTIDASALWVSADGREDGYVYFMAADNYPTLPPLDVYDREEIHPGSTTTGSGTGVLLNPPPASGLVDPALTEPKASSKWAETLLGQVFLASGPTGVDVSVKARIRQDLSGTVQARIEARDETGDWHESAWVDLDAGKPSLLAMEYDHPGGDEAESVHLKIDRQAAATLELEAGNYDYDLQFHQIGCSESMGSFDLDLTVEEAEVYKYVIHPGEEPALTDDFEEGFVAAGWTEWAGTGLALATRQTAGKTWLEADLAGGDSFLVDSSPKAAGRARLRFDVDPAALGGELVQVLAVHSSDAWGAANEYVQVFVASQPARLKVLVRDDDHWRSTGWLGSPKADAYHVELELLSASAAAAGRLQVWFGAELAEIDGLNDPGNRVETVRFGVLEVAPQSSGKLYLDNYQLWLPHVPDCRKCT